MNIFENYPDIISSALIPMIIAIFALAFPLLIQTISRIDDKYNSTKLIELFKNECISKWYIGTLFSAIAAYILWLLQLHPWFYGYWFLDNSALFLLLISSIALIAMTFIITYLTYIYFVPNKLLNHLIKLYNKTRDEKLKNEYFEAISKILFYSINKADELLARDLASFLAKIFAQIKGQNTSNVIVYPKEFYNTIFEANELLCKRDKRTISLFNEGALFDLFLDVKISSDTYRFIWKCLIQAIRYDRTDIVFAYWRKAHQLFSLFMPSIHPILDYSVTPFATTNQSEIDKRETERDNYLEFHYMIGAVLLYKQKYNILKEIMNFTQMKPPKYVLVPERMQQVIEKYMEIDSNEYTNPVYYEQRYWFPEIYGVNSEGLIRLWLKRYLSVLFLRQYTLAEYNVNSYRLSMPSVPENLYELSRWKEESNSLEYIVNDYLTQSEILTKLGFEQFSDKEWFKNNNKMEPSILIENFKKELQNKFLEVKRTQPISPDKEKEFQEKTIKYLKPILKKYSSIFTNNSIGADFKKFFIDGQHYILEKAAFSSNQDVSYINTDSITAEAVSMQFQYYALNSLILIFPKKYILVEKDMFLVLDKFDIDSSNFIIISIGLDIEYYSHFNIEKLNKLDGRWYYNEIEIQELDFGMNELAGQSLFILRKEDLPNIIFREVNGELRKKFNLDRIDETLNLYTKINNLSLPENKQLKVEVEKESNESDLSEKVLVCVDINVEIQLKQNIKCIQLKAFSPFDDRGQHNEISDVKDIWNEGKKVN